MQVVHVVDGAIVPAFFDCGWAFGELRQAITTFLIVGGLYSVTARRENRGGLGCLLRAGAKGGGLKA